MRTASAAWEAIQSEDATPPSLLDGLVETKDISTDPDTVNQWQVGNGDSTDNAVSASIISVFDPTRVTFPFDSCTVEIENAAHAASGDSPVADYDFSDAAVYAKTNYPGRIDLSLGYRYDTGGSEILKMSTQRLNGVDVSDDDLYVKFEGIAFADRLDQAKFYGGRYVEGGIAASTLFTEILEDVVFPNEGEWAYVLGDAACKVYAAGAYPLWAEDTFEYYHIDSALDDIMVEMPIPVVTHREALVMLAAYCGAYLLTKSDGSIHVTTTLGAINSYHMDIGRVYERPKVTRGTIVGTIRGFLHSYREASEVTEIAQLSVNVDSMASAYFSIEHEACRGTTLTLVGADLIGTPSFNTYGTVFQATPTGTTFTAILEGYAVEIGATRFDAFYTQSGGEIREFDNPLASDPLRTSTMYDAYVEALAQTTFTFGFRDDPRIEVGDRLYLDMLAASSFDSTPVLVTSIKRDFNGGLDAEYTVITDPNADWIQEDFVQLDFVQYVS